MSALSEMREEDEEEGGEAEGMERTPSHQEGRQTLRLVASHCPYRRPGHGEPRWQRHALSHGDGPGSTSPISPAQDKST